MNMSIGNVWNETVEIFNIYGSIMKNIILLLLACAFVIVVIKIIAELGK